MHPPGRADLVAATGANGDQANCSVSGGDVSCTQASLGAGAGISITIPVTASQSGMQSVQASVTVLEFDADTANNTAQTSINVTARQDSGDSGGGAVGLLVLLLLAGAVSRGSRSAVPL